MDLKTEKDYVQTFKNSKNVFLRFAVSQGWSLEAIIGVYIERDATMLNKIIDLERFLSITAKQQPTTNTSVAAKNLGPKTSEH